MHTKTRSILCYTALALTMTACSSQHDSKTEERVIKALQEHRTDQVTTIDLNTLLPKGWTKVCVQLPYMMQDQLEKSANTKMKNYKMLVEEGNLLMWVFYGNEQPRYITIPRNTTMDFSSPNVIHDICTTPQQPDINMTMIKDSKTFYFN